MQYVICHYSEIGLKGNNRSFFEKKLVSNIKEALPSGSFTSVRRPEGRIVIRLNENAEKTDVESSLKKVFGLAYFSFAKKIDSKLETIKKETVDLLKKEKLTPNSFRVTTKRADKSFPHNSPVVSREVGASVFENFDWQVDLEDFDLNVFIEITREGSFIYFKKIKGYGGLPVGSSGRGTLLLSGGIDSPVAGFKMLKRGLALDFVHFHAYPLVSNDSIKKAEKLFKVLKKYAPESKLFLMPFGEIQKKIRISIPEKYRIIFYRRLMLKIAEELAHNRNAGALVTGESLGQVSSQTLPNMRATEEVTDLPILRPLVGENKKEIISKAREIKTYEISILPDQDCCTLFNPRSPETKSNLKRVLELEEKLDLDDLIEDCIENKRVLT
ncbi:MAG: tRNA uracil 4-sulfurtransferase ThiI [Patescibacteria group bacterium]